MMAPTSPVVAGGTTTLPAAGIGGSDRRRKRRPAGTPDPDAEVVSLTVETLLESERYVCEICNQGFQREQNLQMHRRRHKVPWKLVKREATSKEQVRKRVYVCPEPSCLHHDPCHALGDLVGIKKHFRRKHSNHKQWACARCSKAYAVQSDYKAHLKTCGTRGHSCDCGRVFSRVESFIEHQDACHGNGTTLAKPRMPRPVNYSPRTTISNPSRAAAIWSMLNITPPPPPPADLRRCQHNYLLELQLLPAATSVNPPDTSSSPPKPPVFTEQCNDDHNNNNNSNNDNNNNNPPTQLHLSIGPGKPERRQAERQQQLLLAVAEKAAADEARRKARRQVEMAEEEFSNARRTRQQAQSELGRAMVARDQAMNQIKAMMLQITCNACRQRLGGKAADGSGTGERERPQSIN